MLWWFEWIDQEDRFGVYAGIARFIAGEELRDPQGRCIAPATSAGLWCRAWLRPGRMLGYLLDQDWGLGKGERPVADATLRIGTDIAAGPMTVAWWDPDRGVELGRVRIDHPGGALELRPPAFRRHLAFKLRRDGG
jgi:hypothetical protein